MDARRQPPHKLCQSLLNRQSHWHWQIYTVPEQLISPLCGIRSSERLEVSIQNLESFSLASAYFWYARVDGITSLTTLSRREPSVQAILSLWPHSVDSVREVRVRPCFQHFLTPRQHHGNDLLSRKHGKSAVAVLQYPCQACTKLLGYRPLDALVRPFLRIM